MDVLNLPEVGKTYVHKRDGDVTVSSVTKKGRGYYVLYAMFGGDERRTRLQDWRKAVV